MSDRLTRRTRRHALAAATAIALAAMVSGPALAGSVNATGLTADGTDRFIVKYREGSAERASVANVRAATSRVARVGGKAVALGHVRRMAIGADVLTTDRRLDRAEAEALMRQIAADPAVEYIEVDKLNKPVFTPNDTRFSEQFGFGTGAGGTYATQAWDVTNGTGAVVAVLDTGITNHSDLNANMLPGYDFIIDTAVAADGNGRDSDPSDPGDASGGQSSSWHGTHVAGTVAAVTNNGKGVAGMAWGAKVVPVRVLGKGGGYDSDIADAIIWSSGGSVSGVPANPNPAEAINLSLGGTGTCGSAMQSAINGAVSRGSTLVIAAGNSNANVSNFSPANCNNVIAVASVTSTGARSSFSNYGSLIDIAAPGSAILSTLNSGTSGPSTESYASYSGTSMAAPHVAGIVALMQSAATTPKTPAEIESILKSTARAFPSTPSQPIGPGIAQARAAVDAVNGGTPPPPPPTGGTLTKGTPVTNLSASTGNSLEYTMTVPSGASNLTFSMSGGTGDADLYVRYGSAPTDSAYDCRPYRSGNTETCTFSAPAAGTYYVRVKAYSSFSGVSLVGDYSTGGGSRQTYTNGTDYSIRDNSTVESPISVSGRSGNAPSDASVSVSILHSYKGDLKVDLVAPDGSVYNLHNRSGGSADNVIGTFTRNLSTEVLNGTWKLRVNDNYSGDTGRIDTWSINF
ncbi:extracellular protease [Lysobacter bugurensis]|uniref:Extracellular protease n=1 Tax=Cognatilysobacter bugurensis TaxID=543356 RepID=A0A918W4V0_9GAMM|nr:extracellular protease [Lysobacter bugurensis]